MRHVFSTLAAVIAFVGSVSAQNILLFQTELGCILVDTDAPEVDLELSEAWQSWCDLDPNAAMVTCYSRSRDAWIQHTQFNPEHIIERVVAGGPSCPKTPDERTFPVIIASTTGSKFMYLGVVVQDQLLKDLTGRAAADGWTAIREYSPPAALKPKGVVMQDQLLKDLTGKAAADGWTVIREYNPPVALEALEAAQIELLPAMPLKKSTTVK